MSDDPWTSNAGQLPDGAPAIESCREWEMRAFDKLPPELRHVLNYMVNRQATISCLSHLQRGISLNVLLSALTEGDLEFSDPTRTPTSPNAWERKPRRRTK